MTELLITYLIMVFSLVLWVVVCTAKVYKLEKRIEKLENDKE